jgi:hypothetical protein
MTKVLNKLVQRIDKHEKNGREEPANLTYCRTKETGRENRINNVVMREEMWDVKIENEILAA